MPLQKVTAEELRKMNLDEVVRRTEVRLGRALTTLERLQFAMLLGAGDTGVMMIDTTPDCGGTHRQTFDFDMFAAFLNEAPAT